MNEFNRVSLAKKVFKKEFTEKLQTKPVLNFTRTVIFTNSVVPIKFYRVNGEIYAYCADKTIRKVDGNAFDPLGFTSNSLPIILPVVISGENKVLFICDQTAVLGNQTVSGIPYGAAGAFCGGRLFIGDGYKIKYSAAFDFTNFNVGLSFGGFIEIDKSCGEIVYLCEDSGKLYVFTEHAILALTVFGAPFEFKLEKITYFDLSIVKNTVSNSGGSVGFICGKDFYMFSSGKVKLISTALHAFNPTFGVAGGNDGAYFLPFTENNIEHTYAYEFATGREIAGMNAAYRVRGDYSMKIGDIRFYRTSIVMQTDVVTEQYSGEYDFGSCSKKALCRLEAHISGNCRLTITGDGSFSSTITEKCNSVSCFVHGKSFAITFDEASADFKLYRFVAHYVIYGE